MSLELNEEDGLREVHKFIAYVEEASEDYNRAEDWQRQIWRRFIERGGWEGYLRGMGGLD